MRVAFISPFPAIYTLGLRGLSSWLREKGHEIKIIHMARPSLELSFEMEYILRYPDTALAQLVDHCKDCQLIGLSLFTQHFEGIVQLIEYFRRKLPEIPIILGGIHPTVKPEECIQLADYVCLGEGEYSLLELIMRLEQDLDTSDIPGLWIRKETEIFRNPAWPLEQNLDVFPPPDYGIENHFIYLEQPEKIVPMTWDLLRDYLHGIDVRFMKPLRGRSILYRTLASRGCPLNCTYCCNNVYRKLYPKQNYVRHRSVPHLITELLWMKQHLPWVTMVSFEDDSFLAAPLEIIKQFSQEYREKIGLPFRCLHEPLTFSEEKLEYLIEGGMADIQIGIETIAKNTLRMYNRSGLRNKFIDAAQVLAKVSQKKEQKLFVSYDLIIDNPWETDNDLLETLQFVVNLPGNFRLNIFSLVFFPVQNSTNGLSGKESLLMNENKFIGKHRNLNS